MTYTPPPAAPPPPYRPQPGAPKRAWWKAGWFIALAAAILGIGIGAASGTAKTKTVAGPTTTATTTATATATATPTVIKTIATHVVTATVTYTPPPVNQFTDGTYQVGRDIPPGQYRSPGQAGGGCYWERLSSLGGGVGDIIANDNFDGSALIQVNPGEYLTVSGGCSWSRVG